MADSIDRFCEEYGPELRKDEALSSMKTIVIDSDGFSRSFPFDFKFEGVLYKNVLYPPGSTIPLDEERTT